MNEETITLYLVEYGIWLAKSAAIFACAGLFCLVLKKSTAALRHSLWKIAAVSALLLPIADSYLPDYFGQKLPATPAPVVSSFASEDSLFKSPAETVSIAQPTESQAPAIPEKTIRLSFPLICAFVALTVSGLLLLRLVLSGIALKLIARKSQQVPSDVRESFQSACEAIGVRSKRVRLIVAKGNRTPMTWGFINPVVLLPESATAWDTSQLRSVLLHELSHVHRADFVWDTLTRVLVALQWMNPLVWVAWFGMDRERERACDAAALSNGVRQKDYARHLLHVVATSNNTRIAAAGTAMARSAKIEGRLKSILTPVKSTSSPLIALIFGGLTLIAAGFTAVLGNEVEPDPIPAQEPKETPVEVAPIQVPPVEKQETTEIVTAVVEETAAPEVLTKVDFDGESYVSIDQIAKRYGFEMTESDSAVGFKIEKPETELKVGGDSRNAIYLNGIRVNVENPVKKTDEGVFFLKESIIPNILDPAFRPSALNLKPIDTVIIDAGHGGPDSGVRAYGTLEKDFNLKLAQALGQALGNEPFKVVHTRISDSVLSLSDRALLTKQYPNAILISLHANYSGQKSVRGCETYINNGASQASTALAIALHTPLIKRAKSVDRGIKNAAFSILKTSLPAALIETGFLSNPQDHALLTDENHQKKMVNALVIGIRNYAKVSGVLKSDGAQNRQPKQQNRGIAHSASGDPSDLYLSGYLMVKDALNFEKNGKLEEASQKYDTAKTVFAAISKSSPGWKSELVHYRLSKTEGDIQRLKELLDARKPG